MKKISIVILTIVLCASLVACGGNSTPATTEPPDLTGEWKQVNPNSDTSYQTATITGDVIEVYWVNEDEDSKALYWAGTYAAPDKATDTYTWDSANDKEKTGSAMLASGSDTKTFTYNDGQISYEVSAMGVTQTVKLEKQ